MAETKKLSPAQRARLGGLARARLAGPEAMKRMASKGGAAIVEKYGKEHMTRLALRKNGFAVALGTET